jgi:uracil-DNA glycosylase
MIPLIIGQAPGVNGCPEPLAGRCGRRLADLAGLSLEHYLARFERMNLLAVFPGKDGKGDAFPQDQARDAAIHVIGTGVMLNRRTVLLGQGVAAAFGVAVSECDNLRWYGARSQIAICPHPSGINRWWNVRENIEAARVFWTSLAQP